MYIINQRTYTPLVFTIEKFNIVLISLGWMSRYWLRVYQLLTEHFTDGNIIATVQNEEEDKMLVIRNMNQGDNFTKRRL